MSTSALPTMTTPPADELSALSQGPLHTVHGPKIAYNLQELDNANSLLNIEPYDIRKGKQQAFTLKTCKVNCCNCDAMRTKLGPTCLDYGPLSSSSIAAPPPQTNPAPDLSFNSTLDLLQVPGGIRQSHMMVWLCSTDMCLADQWSDYVPLNTD